MASASATPQHDAALPETYARVAPIFGVWSRLMEHALRRRAAASWDGHAPTALVCPPTDCGLAILARRQRSGPRVDAGRQECPQPRAAIVSNAQAVGQTPNS